MCGTLDEADHILYKSIGIFLVILHITDVSVVGKEHYECVGQNNGFGRV